MALETGNYIASLVATNPPGTDPKSQGDDHLRLIKNALLSCFAGFTGSIFVTGTDGGAANAYTLTPATALLAYSTRMVVAFAPTVQNTGASTLNISALGVKDIKSVSGAALVSGDLEVGTIYTAYYNGTEFRLLSITKNYADQLSFTGVLPAQAGNTDKFITTNGTVASWSDLIKVGTMKFADSTDATKRVQFDLSGLTTAQTRTMRWPDRSGYVGGMDRSARTANAILTTADHLADIIITGAGGFTQTLTAAATLGSGWNTRYSNFTTGNITFDPNASELIDGATTGILEPGMTIDIFCDGTKFDCERVGPAVTKILTSGTSGTWPLGVRTVQHEQVGGGGGGGRTNTTAPSRGANSGAAAVKQWVVSPNTAYTYAIGAAGVGAAVVNTSGTAGGATSLTYSAVTVTSNGGAAGDVNAGIQTIRQTSTNGDINLSSGIGEQVQRTTGSNPDSKGGDSPLGNGEGGNIGQALAQSVAPEGFGSGGASGYNAVNGQNGIAGAIFLRY